MPDLLPHLSQWSVPPRSRRYLLFTAAALAVGQATRAAASDAATLLLAGPAQGATAAWANLILPALAHALPPGIRLGRESVGGADGVTAANQFEARAAADGEAVLLLPGAAALAWLVGDPRARFDAAQWVTALAGTTSAVLASRLPLERIVAGQVVRVAGSPAGPALPALLTLDLIGALPQAVPDRPDQADTDAVVLHGRDIRHQLDAAFRAGFVPVLAFCERDASGRPGRDPDFPELPSSGERLAPGSRQPLAAALRAAVAAARLDTALVLPPLTSPSMVALWRRACAQAATAPATQAAAARLGVHAETDAAAVASTAPLAAVDAAVLLDLRQWLAQRFGWNPS
jgi:hypothetical protein